MPLTLNVTNWLSIKIRSVWNFPWVYCHFIPTDTNGPQPDARKSNRKDKSQYHTAQTMNLSLNKLVRGQMSLTPSQGTGGERSSRTLKRGRGYHVAHLHNTTSWWLLSTNHWPMRTMGCSLTLWKTLEIGPIIKIIFSNQLNWSNQKVDTRLHNSSVV